MAASSDSLDLRELCRTLNAFTHPDVRASAFTRVRRYAREALLSPKQAFILQWFLLRELEPESLVRVGESLQLVQVKDTFGKPDLVERDKDFANLGLMIACPPPKEEAGDFGFRWELRDTGGLLIWDSEEWVEVHRQDPVNINVLLGGLWEIYTVMEASMPDKSDHFYFIPEDCAQWVECLRGERDSDSYLLNLAVAIEDRSQYLTPRINILGLARRTLYCLEPSESRHRPSFEGIILSSGTPFQVSWVSLVKALTWPNVNYLDNSEVEPLQERWQQIFLRRLLDEFCDAYIANVI